MRLESEGSQIVLAAESNELTEATGGMKEEELADSEEVVVSTGVYAKERSIWLRSFCR